jgi:hypothetical protein
LCQRQGGRQRQAAAHHVLGVHGVCWAGDGGPGGVLLGGLCEWRAWGCGRGGGAQLLLLLLVLLRRLLLRLRLLPLRLSIGHDLPGEGGGLLPGHELRLGL